MGKEVKIELSNTEHNPYIRYYPETKLFFIDGFLTIKDLEELREGFYD